ncbi:MAG: hypothetical protein F6J90_08590 [Moorea sp. SIOASIH]|uniref:hypothetical protein n=1 Tax=Moorena sp. SIOASIH TaxID=2607817 RepID=UPI0013BBD6E7|nr:hypothetical protein [Moorena sp. SIOASIH]NEO36372.1 hypothetical protein [Moorena sp. SIOASIH]
MGRWGDRKCGKCGEMGRLGIRYHGSSYNCFDSYEVNRIFSLFPVPDSRFPIPDSRFPIPTTLHPHLQSLHLAGHWHL